MVSRLILLFIGLTASAGSIVIFVVTSIKGFQKKYPGAQFIRLPLIPLTLYTGFEIFFILFSIAGYHQPDLFRIMEETGSFIRLFTGYGFVTLAYNHLKLNDIRLKGLIPLPLMTILTLLNSALFLLKFPLPALERIVNGINMGVLGFSSIYAGACAIIGALKNKSMIPSTWAGFWIGVFYMINYPLILIADFYGLPVSFFDPSRPLSRQLIPFRLLVVLLLVVVHLRPRKETLTERESEIAGLLRKGATNKQIAEICCLSLATVKTHVNNILKKYKVASRKDIPQPGPLEEPAPC